MTHAPITPDQITELRRLREAASPLLPLSQGPHYKAEIHHVGGSFAVGWSMIPIACARAAYLTLAANLAPALADALLGRINNKGIRQPPQGVQGFVQQAVADRASEILKRYGRCS